MKKVTTLKQMVSNTKVQLAMGLAVASVGLLMPDSSKSKTANPTNFCTYGEAGDCVLITDGNKHCSSGSFWNDCN